MHVSASGGNMKVILAFPFAIRDMALRIAVPEPSGLLLMLVALTAANLARLRRS
jgi:hypothetical protein